VSPDKSTVGAKVSPPLEERIEEHQESEGYTNKSDAVRDLIETGLESKDDDRSIPLGYGLVWFGSLVLMLPVQTTPGTNDELIFLIGTALILTGVLTEQYNLIAKYT